MSGYGKHFSSMYEGSMYGAGLAVFAVWGWIISHVRNGTVELNPKLIAAQLGGPEAEVRSAIEVLCAPDSESRNPDEDGRRLVHEGAFLYRVVSHGIYASKGTSEDRKEYLRRKQAESRMRRRQAKQDVNSSGVDNTDVYTLTRTRAYASDSDSESESEKSGRTPPVRTRTRADADEQDGSGESDIDTAVMTREDISDAPDEVGSYIYSGEGSDAAEDATEGQKEYIPLTSRADRYLRDPLFMRLELGDATEWPEVVEVLGVWAEVWKPVQLRGGLRDPRLKAVLERMSDGYTVAQLADAIRGSRNDEFIRGKRQLQSLATVFKSAASVDKYRELRDGDPGPVQELTGMAKKRSEALTGLHGERAQALARQHEDPMEWYYAMEGVDVRTDAIG